MVEPSRRSSVVTISAARELVAASCGDENEKLLRHYDHLNAFCALRPEQREMAAACCSGLNTQSLR